VSTIDKVALVNYNIDLEETLRDAIKIVDGFNGLESPVLIKPNICSGEDVTGVANTNVELVEALIRLLYKEEESLSIKIVESDSESKYADEAFKKFGYKDLEDELKNAGFDVSLINLSNSRMMKVNLDGYYFKNPEFPEEITGSKFFISLAIGKTHPLTLITGSIKNLFGLLPRKDQSFYHPNINDVIVDLARFVRPNLSIIDAIVGMEGVTNGNPVRVNRIIAGKKPVSVDSTLAKVMGFDAERIRHLVKTSKHNLGNLNPEIIGDLESSKIIFKKPTTLRTTALID
jgi:uncharacterized protein (DUF362 family)